MQKLITIDNIRVVLSQQSSTVLALSPVANNNKVILMDVGSTTPLYASLDDYTFRVSYPASLLARGTASALNKKGIQKLGLLYVDNDYGSAMANEYKKNFKGSIVAEQKFSQESTDFRTQLEKIKATNPDALAITAQSSQTGLILKQKKELNLMQPIYSDTYTMEYPAVLQAAGDAAEGVIYSAQYYDLNNSDSVFKEFNDVFVKKYNQISNPLSAQTYDGLMVLAFAMSQCKNPEDTDCIKNKLFETENFHGVTGNLSFDRYGEGKEKAIVLKTVKNGSFVVVEESD
jgi:branched-chain amino acid transport system substrate-binding protein